MLINCPPGDPSLIDAALRTADAVIVPTSPSGIEVARMWETLEIITDKPAAVLITSAQLNTTTLEDLLNALDEAGVPTFPTSFSHVKQSNEHGAPPPPNGTDTTALPMRSSQNSYRKIASPHTGMTA
ncbi:hypothetical protein KFR76_08645 [Corynebacterium diphtheriae]|nr:hypothetical protein KFR76_08645 [Corynebacterium diphtheriae]